MDKKKII